MVEGLGGEDLGKNPFYLHSGRLTVGCSAASERVESGFMWPPFLVKYGWSS